MSDISTEVIKTTLGREKNPKIKALIRLGLRDEAISQLIALVPEEDTDAFVEQITIIEKDLDAQRTFYSLTPGFVGPEDLIHWARIIEASDLGQELQQLVFKAAVQLFSGAKDRNLSW